MEALSRVDPDIANAVRSELLRQRSTLGMIASENFCSLAVLEAQSSVIQNKYSEGYPGKRYYGGNEFADIVESLAIERAKKLFGAEYANVQSLAGSPANMAAYFALLNLGDKIMSLSLAHGGHLTHGSPVSFSGKWYKIIPYELSKETGMLDYDAIRKQANREKPDLILCGYTAYPREINFREFKEIADEVDAYLMVDISHIAGLIAGGVHPSPIPYADIVTTTTHKTLRGPRGAIILSRNEYGQKVDKAVFPGLQGGPFDHVVAAKAVCFKEAMGPEFKDYAEQIVKNTKELASEMMKFDYNLVSGGTDNHLILVDLQNKHITGKEAQEKLNSVGIIINKNMVPFDPQTPFVTSGIRVGTPGLTTRGMKEGEMRLIAGMIARVIESREEQVLNKVKQEVLELCKEFPIYKELG